MKRGRRKQTALHKNSSPSKNMSEVPDAGGSHTGCRKRMTDILHGGRECMETMENIASVVFKATTD